MCRLEFLEAGGLGLEAEIDRGAGRDPSAAGVLRDGGRRVKHAPKLSIRNWDVIDLGLVRGISNFFESEMVMGAGARDGEREKLKLFPIRKLQVVNFEAFGIF